jgi:hypothetical protein
VWRGEQPHTPNRHNRTHLVTLRPDDLGQPVDALDKVSPANASAAQCEQHSAAERRRHDNACLINVGKDLVAERLEQQHLVLGVAARLQRHLLAAGCRRLASRNLLVDELAQRPRLLEANVDAPELQLEQ